MKSRTGTLLICTLLAGCIPRLTIPTPPDVHLQKPIAFPYPGIYVGAISGASLAYQLAADGTGRSCIRYITGSTAFGDTAYDGGHLYTQDGAYDVVSLSSDRLLLRVPHPTHGIDANLQKVSEAPTVCQDFFRK